MVMLHTDLSTTTEGGNVLRSQRTGWEPPPEGVWKINVDGAFSAEDRKGAWGFVVRDSEGGASLAGASDGRSLC